MSHFFVIVKSEEDINKIKILESVGHSTPRLNTKRLYKLCRRQSCSGRLYFDVYNYSTIEFNIQ